MLNVDLTGWLVLSIIIFIQNIVGTLLARLRILNRR